MPYFNKLIFRGINLIYFLGIWWYWIVRAQIFMIRRGSTRTWGFRSSRTWVHGPKMFDILVLAFFRFGHDSNPLLFQIFWLILRRWGNLMITFFPGSTWIIVGGWTSVLVRFTSLIRIGVDGRRWRTVAVWTQWLIPWKDKNKNETFFKIFNQSAQCQILLEIWPFLPHFSPQNWRVIIEVFHSNFGFAWLNSTARSLVWENE